MLTELNPRPYSFQACVLTTTLSEYAKKKPQTFQLPDLEIYVANCYDKSREGQMYICDSTFDLFLYC